MTAELLSRASGRFITARTTMNLRAGLLACTALSGGCFNPTGSTDTTGSSDPSSTGEAGTSLNTEPGTASAGTLSTSTSSTSNPSTTTITASTGSTGSSTDCGNGQLDDGEECDDGAQEPDDGCSSTCTKEFRRVFVTSQFWSGALGGVEGADQKCQGAADAAGLPGDYKAWISTADESPSKRFIQSTVPYRQINGVEVAHDWNELVGGTLQNGIIVSELNGPAGKGSHTCMPVEIAPVWTGTRETGTMVPGDYFCSQWNGTVGSGMAGRAGATNSQWTQDCITTCQDQAALYCVEQ